MLSEQEIKQRLRIAQENKSQNVNCIGFVLFMLGITSKETDISPTAYRIKQNLIKVPSIEEAQAFGIWSLEGRFYPHMAYIFRTSSETTVFEREGQRLPVRSNTLKNIVEVYARNFGVDRIEKHFLALKQ